MNVWGKMGFVFLFAAGTAMAGSVQRFYVAPDGDDTASGSWWHPFASFSRAQEAVKRFRECTPERDIEGIEVLFAAGNYRLAKPIVLEPDHGGTEIYRTTYRAESKNRPPVFSGGHAIKGWRVRKDGVWETTLPEVKEGRWVFSELWVNGTRRFRPRVPAEGWLTAADDFGATKDGIAGFVFASNDVSAAWANLPDIEFHVLHIWSASRMRAASIDAEAHAVKFPVLRPYNTPWSNFKGRRYCVENVKEAFGKPGTWYLDRPTGVLEYKPLAGETPENCTVEAPRLEQLLIVQGLPDRPVINTELDGLVFRVSDLETPREGRFAAQAAMTVPASVEVNRAEGVEFSRCVFAALGGYAIAFGPGAHSNKLDYCVMSDLGAGGVKIGPPFSGFRNISEPKDPTTSPAPDGWARTTSAITVSNCRIVHGGRIDPAGEGVWIGHSSFNKILHNDIGDLYYTAVSVGWVWGYAEPSRAHHNEIAYNHLHDIGQRVLSDMGGVYTLGLSPGTTVHNNRIHNIHAFDYGGWGLYTDEGSTGIHLTSNLVYDVKTGGFHQHYGKDNVLENNIFANSLKDQLQRTRMEDHISFRFRHNIVYWDNDGNLLGSNWKDGKRGVKDGKPTQGYEMSSNLYWHTKGNGGIFPGKKSLVDWQAEMGQENGSITADPLFVDPAHGNFRLRTDTPAKKIGFKPFDAYDCVGPEKPRLLPDWADSPAPSPYFEK